MSQVANASWIQNCWQGGCLTTKDNLRETFPVLRAPPRPEPDSRNKADHPAWEKEYNNWGTLRCRCGNGYFCREHGDWISGEEVTSGVAVDGKNQKKGGCPGSHYRGKEFSVLVVLKGYMLMI